MENKNRSTLKEGMHDFLKSKGNVVVFLFIWRLP